MNFVYEKHIARFKIGQDRRQITRFGQNWPRCHAKPHPQFSRHDLCQCGFTQTGWAVKQRVIHRLPAHPRAFDENFQIGARLVLADEIVQHLWAQGAVGLGVCVFGQRGWAQGGIGFGHFLCLVFCLGCFDHALGAKSLSAARIRAAVAESGASLAACATALAASPWL